MKTKTINLYSIEELTDKAKQTAYNDWLQCDMYGWHNENKDTLKTFCDLFGVTLNRHGDYRSVYNGSNFEDLENLSGPRLLSYLWNRYGKQIFKPKQYWICNGHKNAVGTNAKKRLSKIFTDPYNCVLTGYHMDNYILAPIIEFMTGEKQTWVDGKLKIERIKFPKNQTFEDLLMDCISEFNKAVENDHEDSQSFERFIEDSQANEWTYTAHGKIESAN